MRHLPHQLLLPRTRLGVPLALLATLVFAASATAMTSHAGWPSDQHLVMDKGPAQPAGQTNVLTGEDGVHNYLLGGYGNDTIYGGDAGDVIWGDYHPSGESTQTAIIHAGDGPNFIYANDTFNYVWTGTNPDTVVHAHEDGGRDPLRKPRDRRLHEPPRAAALEARRLPSHQLLLRRVLS